MSDLMLPSKTLFRIESLIDSRSLWYKPDGSFDPFITTLTEGISASLPMEYDDTYGFGGKRWYSSCDQFDNMRMWFSDKDAEELYEAGFVLREYEVNDWRELPRGEVVFTREGVISKKEIDIATIWNINSKLSRGV